MIVLYHAAHGEMRRSEVRDEGLSTVTERECLDCGCMYSAIRRKQSEWVELPAPPEKEE